MWTDPNQLEAKTRSGHFGAAVVLGPMLNGRTIPILLADTPGHTGVATVPELSVADPEAGDSVLVAGKDLKHLYMLAVVERREGRSAAVERIETADGGRVEIETTERRSKVSVYARNGRLLFEYEPHAEKVRVDLQADDLEFATTGRIAFSAGERIELAAPDIRLDATRRARVGIVGSADQATSGIDIHPGEMVIESPQVGLTADTGRFAVRDASYQGNRLSVALQRSRVVIDRMESISKTVIAKATNVYRTVEQLAQLRTGRMRTIVESTYHLKSRKAYLKAREDFNVDGEKINLG